MSIQKMSAITIIVMHMIAILLMAKPRFSYTKSIGICSGFALLSIVGCVVIYRNFPEVSPIYLTGMFSFAVVIINYFVIQSEKIGKALFIYLTYSIAFTGVIFVSVVVGEVFFHADLLAIYLIRTLLHTALIAFWYVWLRNRFEIAYLEVDRGWWSLDVVGALFILLLLYSVLWKYPLYSARDIVVAALLYSLTIAVYVVIFSNVRYMSELVLREKEQFHYRSLERTVQDMEASLEDARRNRHDIRHHNLQIAEYAKNGEISALLDYLQQYEEAAQSKIPARLCKNLAVNNIFATYIHKAEQQGIATTVEISVPEKLDINNADLVAILANLMENAIHGCLRSGKPRPTIKIWMGVKSGKLAIAISNTAPDGLVFEKGLPKTVYGTGIGIKSILHSVHKYHGDADFAEEDGIFVCRILLPL